MQYDFFYKSNLRSKPMSLGDNLKRLRTNSGMTQGDLSEISGVRVAHLSKLERDDDADPKLSTITKLMRALDCSADQLIPNASESDLSTMLKSMAGLAAKKLRAAEVYQVINVIDRYLIASDTRIREEDHYFRESLELALRDAEEDEHAQDFFDNQPATTKG